MIFRSKYSIGRISRSNSRKSFGAIKSESKQMQKKTGTFLSSFSFFGGGMGFIGFLILAISAYFIVNSENFPKIDDLNTYIPPETTKIYAQNGRF